MVVQVAAAADWHVHCVAPHSDVPSTAPGESHRRALLPVVLTALMSGLGPVHKMQPARGSTADRRHRPGQSRRRQSSRPAAGAGGRASVCPSGSARPETASALDSRKGGVAAGGRGKETEKGMEGGSCVKGYTREEELER